ncbi:hypothetical protein LCGC14_2835170 [marine sediment metagenome]|uniref:Uncharacterized protein n=1 Tax=marine sediment metagenome TaxID=412755 RepID=A0A0F8YCS9_9ZZZZ
MKQLRQSRKFWFVFGYFSADPYLVDIADSDGDVWTRVPRWMAEEIIHSHNAGLTPREYDS